MREIRLVRGDGGDEDDAPRGFGGDEGTGDGLGGEEGAGGVDVEGAAPFLGGGVDGGGAGDDAGEADEDVDGAERGCAVFDCTVERCFIGDIDYDTENFGRWEIIGKASDLLDCLGGERYVAEQKAGSAMFE